MVKSFNSFTVKLNTFGMEAMRKLKLGKAPGSDGITAEMLKYGGEIMKENIREGRRKEGR